MLYMNKVKYMIIGLTGLLVTLASCQSYVQETGYAYYDKRAQDTIPQGTLTAISSEEFVELGSEIAFVNQKLR